jgi:hypothetical protein
MKKLFFTITLLMLSLYSFAQWATIATDPSGDSGGMDATSIEFQYDKVKDEVTFRINVTNLSSYSTGPAADFSFQLPNGLESGNGTGTHWTSSTPVHKTAYIYCDAGGSAPNNYTFTSWSQRIEETKTTDVLCNNCVSINVDVANNQITYTFDRKDIISDSEMGGKDTAEITLVANVGHDVSWDDNITQTAKFKIIRNTTSLTNAKLPEVTVYPNPTTDALNIQGSEIVTKVDIKDITGKVIKKLISYAIKSVDVSELAPGTYFITIYDAKESIGYSKFVKL